MHNFCYLCSIKRIRSERIALYIAPVGRRTVCLCAAFRYACACNCCLPIGEREQYPSALHNTLEDYAKRLQQQYDWTDALTSYQIGASNEDNRLRTRRQERVSSSWQVRIHVEDLHAVLRYQASCIAHNINRIVALSRMTPLSLSKEKISFPFHSFW